MAYADSIRTTDYTREELATLIDDNNTQTIINKQLSNAVLTAGTPPNYTATLTPAPTAYTQGMSLAIIIHSSLPSGGGATLNVNGLGAKNLKITTSGSSRRDPTVGELSARQVYIVTYESALDSFQIANPTFAANPISFTTTIGSQAGTAGITSQSCDYQYINGRAIYVTYQVTFSLSGATSDYITFTLPVNAGSESVNQALGSGYVNGVTGYSNFGMLAYCDAATRFAVYRNDQNDFPIDGTMNFYMSGLYLAA